jgi:NADH:ubiquinone oxidoreductase subunit 2 (subunit N)
MSHPYAPQLADLFNYLLPEMVLLLVACVLFMGGLFKADRQLWSGVALAGLALALVLVLVGPMMESLGNTVFAIGSAF